MTPTQLSLIQKALLNLLISLAVSLIIYAICAVLSHSDIMCLLVAACGFICVATGLLFKQLNHHQRQLATLFEGVKSFKDGDFTIRVVTEGDHHMQELLQVYNSLADNLKQQKQALNQKELLLDSIIQASPMAIILFNPYKQVVYHNRQANELLGIQGSLQGKSIHQLMDKLDNALFPFLLNGESGLVTYEENDFKHSYYVANKKVQFELQQHQLVICKNLSQELSKEELLLWKNAIRLISHELNNSLAPITSLTASAKDILEQDKYTELLPDILATINQRANNLNQFIAEYAEFARLPKPIVSCHDLTKTMATVQGLYPFTLLAELPCQQAMYDEQQFELVLINLLKNAHESGSDLADIGVKVVKDYNRLRFAVVDRGSGITSGKLTQVTLPFFSTKQQGTGLGLSVCSEIINAHQGQLKIKNRQSGGVMVEFDIPLCSDK